MLSFLADEHVERAFVTALSDNGYDVETVAGSEVSGAPDPDVVERARQAGRVILTNDDDFVRIADQRDHAGILLYSDQSHPPAAVVRGVNRLNRHLSHEAFEHHVEWPENWL